MACIYDKDLFAFYRRYAITDASDLVLGRPYWSNWFDGPRVLQAVVTENGLAEWRGMSYADLESVTPRWMIFTDGTYVSLYDHNIGRSYNPWLIFDNEEIAAKCNEELKVTITPSCDDWASYEEHKSAF